MFARPIRVSGRRDGASARALLTRILLAGCDQAAQHAAGALGHFGDDLACQRLDLFVGHGLFARLDRDGDRDRFLARLDALAFIDVEHGHAGDQLLVDILRRAHEVGGLHACVDDEREVARHRLERPRVRASAWRASASPSARGCARGSPRRRRSGRRRRAPRARADAIRRNGRARSAGRSGSCRCGRDETRPVRRARSATPASARRRPRARPAHRPWRRTHRRSPAVALPVTPGAVGLATGRAARRRRRSNWSSGWSPLKICPTSNSADIGKAAIGILCAAATRPGNEARPHVGEVGRDRIGERERRRCRRRTIRPAAWR